jgi:hypothetical protein
VLTTGSTITQLANVITQKRSDLTLRWAVLARNMR